MLQALKEVPLKRPRPFGLFWCIVPHDTPLPPRHPRRLADDVDLAIWCPATWRGCAGLRLLPAA
jgi:hypothetical protein